MPFIYNDTISFKNPIAGDPVLLTQGESDTIDGYTNFTTADYRPVDFAVIESIDTIDGYTNFTTTDYRPVPQQP